MRGKARSRSLLVALIVWMALLLSSCDGQATEALSPTDRFFVNDFADVITAEDENTMYAMGVQLFEKTEAQVVAVTVPSLDGKDIHSYALTLARAWGIGDDEKDNGILLLLAVEDREVRIEVGYGLEGAVTDAQSGSLLDHYALPAFSQNDFSAGMQATYRALVNEVYLEYGLQAEEGYIPLDRLEQTTGEELSPAVMLGVIMFMIAFILLFRNKPWFPWIFFFGGGNHRGGFHGGSGGSFGGFRGGGGSFGGGGASRSF